jgi:hypothetical protein
LAPEEKKEADDDTVVPPIVVNLLTWIIFNSPLVPVRVLFLRSDVHLYMIYFQWYRLRQFR